MLAQRSPTIESEDVLLDEARRMSRGPRIDPELSYALKENVQSLDTIATRMLLPDGTSPTTMNNRILRVAAELGIPVTIRSVGMSANRLHGFERFHLQNICS
jgi:hypothetical protein